MVYRNGESIALLAFAAGASAIGISAFAGLGTGLRIGLLVLGLLLLGLAYWALRIASRPHPHMRRHQVLRLDIAEIEARARSGAPFELQLGRSRFELTVQPTPVADERAPLIVGRKAGEEATAVTTGMVDDVITFAGKADGQERSEVRLTITPIWLSLYVIVDDEWWFVEPMRRFRPEAALDEYVAYRTSDLRFRLPVDRAAIAPPTADDDGSEDVHPIGPVIFVVMLHDREYKGQAGDRVEHHQRALINQVNGVFSQVGIEFRIAAFIDASEFLLAGDASTMLAQTKVATRALWGDLRKRSERRRLRTEIALATTGKWPTNGVAGIANSPGVFAVSYQWLLLAGGGPGTAARLSYQNMMVTAHELGHCFDATHDEADKWCVTHFITCWDYQRTLMWPELEHDTQPFFSNGSITPAHNNAQRVRNNVATGRIRDFG
jgi:hypothetical protein